MPVAPIPRRIAFINEKGGSAKTTLVANVGAWLARERAQRVLAIDMDPQGQLGKVLGLEPNRARRSAVELVVDLALGRTDAAETTPPDDVDPGGLPSQKTRIAGLDVIVANKALGLAPGLGSGEDPTGRLAQTLRRSPQLRSYDYVLFDAPPSFGPLTINVLRAADEVVVPVPLTYLALDGCAELVRSLVSIRQRFSHPRLRITMVVPTFYRRTRLAQEVLGRLRERFPRELSSTVIGFHVKVDEAQSRGLSIFEHAPNDRGARAFAAVADELEQRGAAGPAGERP